ncbi:CRISPR-associated endonuclease Cas2 [Daejeonella sp.]|uniref:CRISPR-associated endonuclease Cas2 n=1 Tax=Daejeonella sp. TaxID=2805397 RepID=UPI003412D9A0
MLLISYDISSNKTRSSFSKYLGKFGHRLQYSLFEIKNSSRILNLIQIEIKNNYSKKFTETDSIMIFQMSANCTITKYGYAKHQDENLVLF